MKVFPITKKNEFKQTVAILDSIELRILIAEAIAKKLNIDLEDKKNSFYYTNTEILKSLISDEIEEIGVAIHFIERIDGHV
ncbi:MAG: hypothetical protein DI627_01485 [Acinetobacter sp.]|uniref:hypothetical protein n=1 Tax=Acinetobacter TaxID=469 RepID=UPI000461297D|nr:MULTISPECIES: hypothetical protein [Acinetobacter]KCX14469.1 hypothetical protein J723_3286 [Acinetobacter sp. 1264765]KQE51513.1 hypothetical protein APD46_17290 [Acinetobacter pittii]MBS5201135.1 hypothetical protein [Acinetobacter sp.]MDP7844824.1 hypothetical protein [Acinetobacter pittii]MDP7872133.1 hypothetical protein [Acinetobacter pittii]